MQKETIARRVKISLGVFLDAMTMPGHLSMRQNGMRQFLPNLRQRFHFLDENVSMTILLSHNDDFDTSPTGINSEIKGAFSAGTSQGQSQIRQVLETTCRNWQASALALYLPMK